MRIQRDWAPERWLPWLPSLRLRITLCRRVRHEELPGLNWHADGRELAELYIPWLTSRTPAARSWQFQGYSLTMTRRARRQDFSTTSA
jgi:hypothetical protein